MLKVITLSELNIKADIDFQKDNDGSFSVLHWQCKGDFTLNADNALCISCEQFNQEAYDFICLAKKKAAAIVLTPEYSFPWECLDCILADPTWQPDQGKLWCLCMQYLPLRAFDQWLNDHNYTLPGTHQSEFEQLIIWDNGLIRNQFVNILAYVFKNTDGKLILLLQSKLFHMRDPQFMFEASGLSLGSTVYIFDQQNHGIKNFCSMICADALSADYYDEISKKLPGRKFLIFHPQLNPDSYFAGIMNYINIYIDKQWSFLRLNWAPDTKLMGSPLKKSGTGYIYKADRSVEDYWNSPNDRGNYIFNRARGLHFLMNKSLRAHWLFPPESHAALYHLRHPKPPATAADNPHPLTSTALYHYKVGVGWKLSTECPWTHFKAIIAAQEQGILDFLTKIHCTSCNGKMCALLMTDRFISLLRGIWDHEVINEAPPDSPYNGCVTNIVGECLQKAQIEFQNADMVSAYLSDICQISEAAVEANLRALKYMVPDGVRIEVSPEFIQNRHSMYNVAGNGTGRFQKGLAIYTDQIRQCDLDKLQDYYGNLTVAEDLGVMLFYPDQVNTIKLHPNIRWGQISDISPSGAMPQDKSDIGLGGI